MADEIWDARFQKNGAKEEAARLLDCREFRPKLEVNFFFSVEIFLRLWPMVLTLNCNCVKT